MNVRLIPPDGVSFGFALRGARDPGAVAAVSGGLKSVAGGVVAAGPCAFGTGEPVIRIILTVMKFNPAIRSAALLQFSDRALRIFKNDLFLESALLDAESKNQGINTMDWGVASCCKDGIPDVIVKKSTAPDGSRIILSGESPADVANNIIICSNRI
jgi:hydroxymethylpyrimidine/phosphomethylpyrimidine kinase